MNIRNTVYFFVVLATFLLLAGTSSHATTVRITTPTAGSTLTGPFDLSGKAMMDPTGSPVKGSVSCEVKDVDDIPWAQMFLWCYTMDCPFSYRQQSGQLITLDYGTYTITCTASGKNNTATDAITVSFNTASQDRPKSDTGSPGDANDPCSGNGGAPAGSGSPVWSVNKINLNLYVTDTPLWYKPPYGPPVEIRLSYNSQGSAGSNSPFGPRWQLNYAGYLVENANGSVKVVMPDGREDLFAPDGQGGYSKPYGVFNELTKTGTKSYRLTFLDGTTYTYAIPEGTTLTNPVLTEIRDSYNQSLAIEYDTNGKLWKVKDALNGETVFSYNAQNHVER